MTALSLADLVVIAMRTLDLDTPGVLGLLDVTAAEAALAEAALAEAAPVTAAEAALPGAAPTAPAAPGAARQAAAAAAGSAAVLLCALIRHHPLRRGNAPVAVAAATTFLALGGWRADLDPPGAVQEVIAAAGAGRLPPAALATWLGPRLSPHQSRDVPDSTDITGQAPAPGGYPPGDRGQATKGPVRGWLPGRGRPGRKKGMFRRFSPLARQVIIDAQREARDLRHGYIGTEHLLLGLLDEQDGVAARALHVQGIAGPARERIKQIIGTGLEEPRGHIPFTPQAKRVLSLAVREAAGLNHLYIGTEHLLLGLLRVGDGLASRVLTDLGADPAQLREQMTGLLASPAPEHAPPVVPPGIRDYDTQIEQAGREKDAAIDARDLDRATAFRDRERALLAERDQRLAQWAAGTGPEALGREIGRLREEVRRLQDLLLQHGIEAPQPGQRSA